MKDSDWRILVTLYEKRSMTKAAEALFLTQPALTKKVRAMEEEWGVEIVKRSSQGVTFTEEGLYLVKRAIVMLDFIKEIEDHFAAGRAVRELLKIGVPNSFARLHMPQLFKAYGEKYDHVQFKTVPDSSDRLVQQLTAGALDMSIICGDYPYLGEKVCLFEEQMYLIVPKDIAEQDIEYLPVIESYFNPIVKLTVDQWWKDHFGEVSHETHKVPYADIAIEMVGSGLGVTFVFGKDWKIDEQTMQRIPVYDRNGHPVSRKVWLMYADRCKQSMGMMEFIDLVKSYYGAA